MSNRVVDALQKLLVADVDKANKEARAARKTIPCPDCSAVCTVRINASQRHCNQCGKTFGPAPEMLSKPMTRIQWLEDNPQ